MKAEMTEKQKQKIAGLQQAIRSFRQSEMTSDEKLESLLWQVLREFQETPFQTAKHLEFSYGIRGHEMFVSRKEKSITKATVCMSFYKAIALREEATGPKKLGTFGASYLYPVFQRIGVIPERSAEEQKG